MRHRWHGWILIGLLVCQDALLTASWLDNAHSITGWTLILIIASINGFVLLVSGLILARYGLFPWRRGPSWRARRLARQVLTAAQWREFEQYARVTVASGLYAGRIYRVPAGRGLIGVYEQDRHSMDLCAQVVNDVPDLDVLVARVLALQADEAAILQTAKTFPARLMLEYIVNPARLILVRERGLPRGNFHTSDGTEFRS